MKTASLVFVLVFVLCNNLYSQDTIITRKGRGMTEKIVFYDENTKAISKVVSTKYFSYRKCIQYQDATCKFLLVITDFDKDGKIHAVTRKKGKVNSWGYRKEKCYLQNQINGRLSKRKKCNCNELKFP